MEKKIRVVPAILTDDPEALATMVRQTETFTDYAQLDIMDGEFVPSRSVTGEDIARLKVKVAWEAHLMVRHPETHLETFRRAGAQRIVFHYEATNSPGEVIARIKALGMAAGLAVNPETPASAITPLIDELDSVLFLAVNPGYYGSQFIPEVLDKIAAFHRARPEMETGIDGSAIFRQPQPGESYRHLLALAEAAAR
jgi:ribulose-phosphate 3-epimerase